ncbi:pre-mRNA-splicing factor CWC25-like [Zerene cesonia]|uniref:pre-mRNA-splicing factor CWC25-like n=1 Tax=Zerene cesonia TaxID=33412 RepID=UPI0018E53838|nr:pre-mRNA-splicing factor CWC25-like [Zerene cesonia]
MHYGSYLFLALLCIFQPIISKGNIVDGRERCDRSLCSELSDRRSYRDVRKHFSVSSPNKISTEVSLTRDDRRRKTLRNQERIDSILQRNTEAIRQLRTDELRSQRRFQYLKQRIILDVRSPYDHNFDDATRKVRFDRSLALLGARRSASSTERADTIESRVKRERRNRENFRSVDDLRQCERRITRNRYSLERNIDVPRDESERRHNLERRLSRNAYHRRQETRQRTHVSPNRSRSLAGEQIREIRVRNAENQERRERRISIENRRNANKRSDTLEVLRNINSQKRERFIATLNREEMREGVERTIRGSFTRSRSLTRSNLRNSVAANMRGRNINFIREKRELESLDGERSETRRDQSRGLYVELRDMEREFAGRQYGRYMVNDKALVREIRGNSEIQKPSRTMSRGADRERVARSELRENSPKLFREAERFASRYERRNNLRDTNEHVSRIDISRNLLNSFKNEEKYGMLNWQIVFYTLQGIYLCSILVKALNRNDNSVKKNRSFGWFPLSTAMKSD